MDRKKDPSNANLLSEKLSRIMDRLLCFVLLLCLSLTAVSAINRYNMNYSEIQQFGNSCPERDSCTYKRRSGNRELDILSDRNCACDYLCEEYGDCCIDAPNFGDSEDAPLYSGWKCRELRQFGSIYIKDTCSLSQVSQDIESFCHRPKDDFSDPLASMPVTDSLTGFTYKNYYCGLCNGKSDSLSLWTPRLECATLSFYNRSRMNLTHEYVFNNLVYENTSWGVYLDDDNGQPIFHECVIDPVIPPLLESKIRLCRTQSVAACPSDWDNDEVRDKCRAYTGLRYFHSESFRNVHCALCNRVNVSLLTCQSARFREYATDLEFRTFEHNAFSLLLDISERKGGKVGYVEKCERGKVFDPFFKRCRSLRCLPGFVMKNGECFPVEIPSPLENGDSKTSTVTYQDPIISLRNDTNILENNSSERNASYVVVSEQNFNLTDEIAGNFNVSEHPFIYPELNSTKSTVERNIGSSINCSTNLLIPLEEEEYIMFENKTVYVPRYDKTYEPNLYFTQEDSLLVCSHLETQLQAKFSPILGYVTVVGLGISMLCLLVHIVLFFLVPDLQNLSGKNLMSQCIALLCAYSFYIAGVTLSNSTSCVAVAFLTFYFFQSSFFWMNAMSFDVWRTLRMATTELRVTNGKQTKRFFLYSVYSWVVPMLVVSLAIVAEYTDVFPEEYRPRFGQPRCWFKHRRSLLVLFAVPLIAVIITNMVLFASSAKMIIMTTKTTAKQQTSTQKRNFTLYLRLFILMGLTWTVGVIAGYADVEFLWYVFVILNTLQGLFIFVAFSCTAKVLGYLRSKVFRFKKDSDFRSSAVHSTSHAGSQTNSTTALSSVMSSSKNSTRLLMSKNSASPTNSCASNFSRNGSSTYR